MTEVEDRPKPSLLSWFVKGGVALAVSVGAIWFALRGVDLGNVKERLKDSDPATLAVFLVVLLAIHIVRVIRWGLLVKPIAPVSNKAIFAAASVGFPATFFLPLRLGEFVRPVMISRSGVPFAAAMASVVVERVADGVVSLGLFFLFLRFLPETARVPDELRTFSTGALIIFGGALIFLIVTCVVRKPAQRLLRKLMSPLPPALVDKIMGLLETFIDGVMVLRTPGRIGAFVGLSLVFWLSNGLITTVLAQSYIEGLPTIAGPFTISVVVFAIMIPAAPGFVGTLQAGFRLGLAPFGIDADSAFVVALAHHALQLAQMAILAGAGFLAADTRQRAAAATPAEPAPDPSDGA